GDGYLAHPPCARLRQTSRHRNTARSAHQPVGDSRISRRGGRGMTTLPQLLLERAQATPHAVALREKDRGIWRELTWADYLARVQRFSLGLRALGLERGDKVAIIGDNRPQWIIAELAAQAAGAVSVGLFQDATP